MQLGETFQERLFGLIDEKGLGDVEVYKKANLDRKLFLRYAAMWTIDPGRRLLWRLRWLWS